MATPAHCAPPGRATRRVPWNPPPHDQDRSWCALGGELATGWYRSVLRIRRLNLTSKGNILPFRHVQRLTT